MTRKTIMSSVVLFFFLAGCCMLNANHGASPGAGEPANVKKIATSICKDVCIVTKTFEGSKEVPVLIFEENHVSRQGQIQQAIALVRLHKQYKLKHIALEGYLKEDRKINAGWFHKAAKGMPFARKAGVAVRLLQEGEISSAEFMKLVYEDITIHPIEKESEYSVKLDNKAQTAPYIFLLKMAYSSIGPEHAPRLKELQQEFNNLKGAAKEKKRKEMFEYVLSVDEWVHEKYKILTGDKALHLSTDHFLAVIRGIETQAEIRGITLTHDEKNAMKRYIDFWDGRDKASKTMVFSVKKLADQKNTSIIAMIVGAAHTEKICNIMKSSGLPFAVLRPISFSLQPQPGDITASMLERKYNNLSVYSEGITKILLNALPNKAHKKPQPVLEQPWFIGKAKTYLYIDQIVHRVLAGGGGRKGNVPPFGFSPNQFSDPWLSINPNRISVIKDKNGKDSAVLIPVVFNPGNSQKRTTIWVKAAKRDGAVTGGDREIVEVMLKQALENTKSKKVGPKLEGKKGIVPITFTTVAGFATSQKAARRIMLK